MRPFEDPAATRPDCRLLGLRAEPRQPEGLSLFDSLRRVRLGQVKPIITERLRLEDTVRAHAPVESGRSMGRFILRPGA